MTVARFLSVFYRYAAKYEIWKAGKPITHRQRVEMQREESQRDVSI